MLKSEKRESQKFKKRYGPRRHKLLGINKWTRKRKEMQESKATEKETEKWIYSICFFCRIFATVLITR